MKPLPKTTKIINFQTFSAAQVLLRQRAFYVKGGVSGPHVAWSKFPTISDAWICACTRAGVLPWVPCLKDLYSFGNMHHTLQRRSSQVWKITGSLICPSLFRLWGRQPYGGWAAGLRWCVRGIYKACWAAEHVRTCSVAYAFNSCGHTGCKAPNQ